jgi:hypothetical protein
MVFMHTSFFFIQQAYTSTSYKSTQLLLRSKKKSGIHISCGTRAEELTYQPYGHQQEHNVQMQYKASTRQHTLLRALHRRIAQPLPSGLHRLLAIPAASSTTLPRLPWPAPPSLCPSPRSYWPSLCSSNYCDKSEE